MELAAELGVNEVQLLMNLIFFLLIFTETFSLKVVDEMQQNLEQPGTAWNRVQTLQGCFIQSAGCLSSCRSLFQFGGKQKLRMRG